MGLYEDLLERLKPVPEAAKFPDVAAPAEEPARDPWDLPKLSDLPQTMLPPHLRKKVGEIDASSPAIQTALGNAPTGPEIPPSLMMHAAGMIPLDQANSPFTTPAGQSMMKGVGVDAPTVPMPTPRPIAAPPPVMPDDGSSPAPNSMFPQQNTDVGARRVGAPLPIAPPVAPAPEAPPAPQAGMLGGASRVLGGIMKGLGDNSNLLMALGAGFAGAPNIGQGISRAAAAAIPARAADIKQSLDVQSRTYGTKALVDAGVPVQQAIAAAGDPDLKKALIKNYIEDRAKKIVEVGQDANTGAKIFAQHDPFTGKLEPIDASKLANGGQSTAGTAADSDITGPDYIAKLKEENPDRARRVEAIIRGDEPFPNGRAAQTPIGAAIIRDVYRAEPGSSELDFKTRQATNTSYKSGLDSRVTKALNTMTQHGAGLEKAISDLHNWSFAPDYTNSAAGFIKRQYDTKYQNARKSYTSNVEPFVKELDFVLSGGKPTVSGQHELRQMFSIDAAPGENMASLHKVMDLARGRLESHAEGFNRGMKLNRDPMDFLDPVNRGHFKRLLGEEAAPEAAAAPAAAPALKPGGSYKMLPDGTLVPK